MKRKLNSLWIIALAASLAFSITTCSGGGAGGGSSSVRAIRAF